MIQPLISEVPSGSAVSSFSSVLCLLQKVPRYTRLPTRVLLLLRGSCNAIPASLDVMEMGFQLWPQPVSLAVELGSLAALSLPSPAQLSGRACGSGGGHGAHGPAAQGAADPLKEALSETEMKNSCNQKCMLSRICAVTPGDKWISHITPKSKQGHSQEQLWD